MFLIVQVFQCCLLSLVLPKISLIKHKNMESHNEDVFESVETPSSDSHVESSVESEIRSEISVFDEWTLMGLNDNAKADVKRLHRIVDKKQATIEELHKQISVWWYGTVVTTELCVFVIQLSPIVSPST